MLRKLVNTIEKMFASRSPAAWLGKTIVVGINEYDEADNLVARHQAWGVIFDFDPAFGPVVQLMGKGAGFYLPLPLDQVDIAAARSGDYREKDGDDLIRDPDFMTVIDILPPGPDDPPEVAGAPYPGVMRLPEEAA